MTTERLQPCRITGFAALTDLLIIGLLMIATIITGCGVKAPPRPPQIRPLPTAADFQVEATPKDFVLSWQIPASSAEDERLEGFRILRYRTALTDEACRECTGGFQEAGTVTVTPELRKTLKMRFADAPEPGFRYFYKVAAFGVNGVSGEDSRVITVSYPQ